MSKLFIIVSCCFFIVMFNGHLCYSSKKNHDDHSSDDVSSPWHHGRGHHPKKRPCHSSSSQSYRIQRHNVKMPSGAVFTISDPVLNTRSSCGNWRNHRQPTLITLNPSGKLGKDEYNIVAQEMQTTNKGDERFEITKIQKVVSPRAWRLYTDRKRQIEYDSGFANETMFFFGAARNTTYPLMYGFDERFSTSGDLGMGLYLTEHSSEARKSAGKSGQLLLCRVSLGKVKTFRYKYRSLAHPPPGYNSVSYVTKSGYSPYFVVYRGEQIYPEFLITYTAQTESDSGQNSDEYCDN